ncbi:MAG TPA: hypothetical protein VGC39_09560, partial [Candidatus Methylacidiphilales bacterium]
MTEIAQASNSQNSLTPRKVHAAFLAPPDGASTLNQIFDEDRQRRLAGSGEFLPVILTEENFDEYREAAA